MTKKLIRTTCLGALAVLPAILAFGQGKVPDDAPLPPDEAGQKAVIADVRLKGAEYEKTVPDYMCTQISHHSIDPKGFFPLSRR